MCGIVGMCSAHTNGFSSKEADVFTTMLFLDQLRGMDSTGVFGVDKHSNVGIAKAAVNGTDFISTSEYKDWRQKLIYSGLFAVGHNRAATRGEVNDKNAHPFWVDDKIVLVQNGTYKGSHKHLKNTEVDTEAVAHVLAEENDIEKALQKVNAAYALVWFDVSKQSLYLIRNDERPLYIAYTKDKNGFIFASEYETILYACSRHNLELNKKPYLLKDHHLITAKIVDNHFDMYSNDINSKFVYKQESNNNMFPIKSFRPNENEYHFGMEQNKEFNLNKQQHAYPDDVKNPFVDYLISDLKHTHIPAESLISVALKEWEEVKSPSGMIMVELQDYKAANNHPNCKTWHVWGYAMSRDINKEEDGNTKQVIPHWIVYNKSEEEMQSYVTDYIYRALPSSTIRGQFMRDHSSMFYLHAYMTNIESIKLITAQEVIENVSH